MIAFLILFLAANIICAVANIAFGNWVVAALNVAASWACAYSLGRQP